jgi:hypothetical protein
MRAKKCSNKSSNPQNQRGVALLILLLIFGAGAMYVLLRGLNQSNLQIERDKITERALAQAKEALIGYAVSRPLVASASIRPGELPCPDMINDGNTWNSHFNSGCSNAVDRLGRLPLKALGLQDLRDGYGERLWYAISNNFKNNPRQIGLPLNSNTNGTIAIKDASGQTIYGDTLRNGVIAVIFAPGAPITRQGATATQDRGCGTDAKCIAEKICTASPSTSSFNTPLCNPANYLESALGNDNAIFSEATISTPSTTGFIQGKVIEATSGNTILNDRFVVITYEDLMPKIEKRVLAEVRDCLIDYANNNSGRYPWPVPIANLTFSTLITGVAGTFFGRLPDPFFMATVASSGASPMTDNWSSCNIGSSYPLTAGGTVTGWWGRNKWYETIFYGFASSYQPAPSPAIPCSACITINTPSPSLILNGKSLVIIAGGRTSETQLFNTDPLKKTLPNYYFELDNATPFDGVFFQGPITSSLNDQVIFSPQ